MTEKSNRDPTNRFSGLAEIYAKARPSYPVEAVDYVMRRCALAKGSTLVDIGSGTGISSRLFAGQGLTVIGIEPNDDMRNQAERESAEHTQLSCQKGTAEETNLPDASADVVLCAQAFHWFNAELALAEFKRILHPNGWGVLIWNERDEKDPFTKSYGDLLRTLPETASVEVPRGLAGQALLVSKLYHDQKLELFSNSQSLDADGLVARAFSASYAPKDKEPADKLTSSLRTLFEQFSDQGSVSIIYQTSVYTGQSN